MIDNCLLLHAYVPRGEVWICDETYRLNKHVAIGRRVESSMGPAWRIDGIQDPQALDAAACTSESDCQVTMVGSLLDLARSRARPHLVTVIGDRREATWRFVTALERSFRARPGLRLLRADARRAERGALDRVLRCGRELADPATAGPTVLLLEHLDGADDAVLDRVDGIIDTADPVPLLVVVTAGTALLGRRPHWVAGRPHSASITVDSAFDRAVAELRSHAFSVAERWVGQLMHGLLDPPPAGPSEARATRERAAAT